MSELTAANVTLSQVVVQKPPRVRVRLRVMVTAKDRVRILTHPNPNPNPNPNPDPADRNPNLNLNPDICHQRVRSLWCTLRKKSTLELTLTEPSLLVNQLQLPNPNPNFLTPTPTLTLMLQVLPGFESCHGTRFYKKDQISL